ncbi:MAG: phage terminase large subunit family protein [Azospirillum sp.]|nr:phage terminase large subunit family protein [Azospirillum sp.]
MTPPPDLTAAWWPALRPPPRLSLSEWAEQHARLPDGSRFHPHPYQRAILDAMVDPEVERITVMKSARVGYTQMLSAAIGFFAAQQPSKIMVVQPTTEDAEDYSKDTIDPMREWPVLSAKLADAGAKNKADTIKRKTFPGGSLRVAGANSPRAFRRIDLDVILFDEIDGYPATAGVEGDQIALGVKRLVQSVRPMAVLGSTPTIEAASKIADSFAAGTMERFSLPCPQCGEYQPLIWGDGTGAGMRWRDNDPSTTHYVCVNGCVIPESAKLDMLAAGRWIAEAPDVVGHRSFHLWSAYCPLRGAAWPILVKEFLDAKQDREKLQVWTNTVRGECWVDRGEAPDWQRLYDRREDWDAGTVPAGGLFLTAGADVQRDRIEVSVWAFGRGKESWLIDHRVIPGDPFTEAPWRALAAMLGETFRHHHGVDLSISMLAIDAGDGVTMEVVKTWARTAGPKVMAIKGSSLAMAPILGLPAAAEVNYRGKKSLLDAANGNEPPGSGDLAATLKRFW